MDDRASNEILEVATTSTAAEKLYEIVDYDWPLFDRNADKHITNQEAYKAGAKIENGAPVARFLAENRKNIERLNDDEFGQESGITRLDLQKLKTLEAEARDAIKAAKLVQKALLKDFDNIDGVGEGANLRDGYLTLQEIKTYYDSLSASRDINKMTERDFMELGHHTRGTVITLNDLYTKDLQLIVAGRPDYSLVRKLQFFDREVNLSSPKSGNQPANEAPKVSSESFLPAPQRGSQTYRETTKGLLESFKR